MNHINSFKQHTQLINQVGEGKAHLIWAMGLYLEVPDLTALASECLTDGSHDKKIDFIKIDREARRIVCAQGYYTRKNKDTAKANKASDLNTAAAWFFSGDMKAIPDNLRPIIAEGRQAIEDGDIDIIEMLYVHNCSESVAVATEMNTLATHLKKAMPPESNITVSARELGVTELERLFTSHETAITIREPVDCPTTVKFQASGPNWKAGVLSINGAWLHGLFMKYGDRLFSANYRGFMGISNRRKINTGIRQSAENVPDNFWVYNNGITILTHGMNSNGSKTKLDGISIINGAQTTGSIGSVDTTKFPLKDVWVLGRIIVCNDADTIEEIIKFNNTQNEMTTWDSYSNSPEQTKLDSEFKSLGYQYYRKRGPRKSAEAIGIEEVAQPLLAFHGHFVDANLGTTTLFDRKTLYRNAFDNASARHILLAYSLSLAFDQWRTDLKKRSNEGSLIEIEQRQLARVRNLKFKNFFISIMSRCLETVIGKRVETRAVAFNMQTCQRSNFSLFELAAKWRPVIDPVLGFVCTKLDEDVTEELKKEKRLESIVGEVNALIYASKVHIPAFG